MKKYISFYFVMFAVIAPPLFSAHSARWNTLEEGIITCIKNDDATGLIEKLSNVNKNYREVGYNFFRKSGKIHESVVQQLLFHILKGERVRGKEKGTACLDYLLYGDKGVNIWYCSEDGSKKKKKSTFLHSVQSLPQDKARVYGKKLLKKAGGYNKTTEKNIFDILEKMTSNEEEKEKVLHLMLSICPVSFHKIFFETLLKKNDVTNEHIKSVLKSYKECENIDWNSLMIISDECKKYDSLVFVIEALIEKNVQIDTSAIIGTLSPEALNNEKRLSLMLSVCPVKSHTLFLSNLFQKACVTEETLKTLLASYKEIDTLDPEWLMIISDKNKRYSVLGFVIERLIGKHADAHDNFDITDKLSTEALANKDIQESIRKMSKPKGVKLLLDAVGNTPEASKVTNKSNANKATYKPGVTAQPQDATEEYFKNVSLVAEIAQESGVTTVGLQEQTQAFLKKNGREDIIEQFNLVSSQTKKDDKNTKQEKLNSPKESPVIAPVNKHKDNDNKNMMSTHTKVAACAITAICIGYGIWRRLWKPSLHRAQSIPQFNTFHRLKEKVVIV